MNIFRWSESSDFEKSEMTSRSADFSKSTGNYKSVSETVRSILLDVKSRGDQALRYYTKQYEGRDALRFELDAYVSPSHRKLEAQESAALQTAYEHIAAFHQLQKPQQVRLEGPGYALWREFLSIERVGIYVPAGTAPLVSTLMMLACPARIAGCREIVLVTPPNQDGVMDSALLFAAGLCGIREIYSLGGAQAIAAIAYGTESIRKVSKIFGPGNAFVTEAKRQVSLDPSGCPIDMPAGPSEVLVIADESANAEFIASDLLAQAEHDPEARAVLVSTSLKLIQRVQSYVQSQVSKLSRESILKESLPNMRWILAQDVKMAMDISNAYAPEHLMIQTANAEELVKFVKNAGSVFIGPWSAEALGDFVSGPNHVLPTAGYARSSGGLGVESFMKSTTFQKIDELGFLRLAKPAHIIGGLEGLDGHQASIAIRSQAIEQDVSMENRR